MRLVTGGCCQGKKQWVMTHWQVQENQVADGATCDDDDMMQAKVLNHFHLLVQRWIQEKKDPAKETLRILAGNKEMIILTDEIGCGIVPLDKNEREWREIHGRICCQLAAEAECVIRVFAGIGQQIK